MVKIERFFAAISGLNLAVVFVVTFAQVIQRYVFNMSIPWATDIIRICFIYSVFGGMCVGVIKKLHLNIDVVAKLVPRKVSKILSLLSNIMIIFFLSIVLCYSIPFILSNMDQYTPYLSFPMSYVYIVFPVTASVMIGALLLDNYYSFSGKTKTVKEGEEK